MEKNTKEYNTSILKKIEDEMLSIMTLLTKEKNENAKNKLETLKLIKSELIRENGKLHTNVAYTMSNNEEIKLLSTMRKSHEEMISAYEHNSNDKAAETEKEELNVIMTYLPKEPTKEEIISFTKSIINTIIGEGKNVTVKDMGKILPKVKEKYPLADGKIIRDTVINYNNE